MNIYIYKSIFINMNNILPDALIIRFHSVSYSLDFVEYFYL